MPKAGQVDCLTGQFNPHQHTPARQSKFGRRAEMIDGQVILRLGGIGQPHLPLLYVRSDRKEEAGAEGVSRALKIAEVHRFRDALDAYSEVSSHAGKLAPERLLGQVDGAITAIQDKP